MVNVVLIFAAILWFVGFVSILIALLCDADCDERLLCAVVAFVWPLFLAVCVCSDVFGFPNLDEPDIQEFKEEPSTDQAAVESLEADAD